MACYGCKLWNFTRKEQEKLLALEINYLRCSSVSRLQKKSQTPLLGAECKQNNKF